MELVHTAAKYGHINILVMLIEYGKPIDTYDNYALRIAAKKGYLDVVKLLIENGADVNARNSESVREAARNGHYQVVKYLVDKGANIFSHDNEALRHSAQNGHNHIVNFLISKDADISAWDNYALRYASKNGHFEVVKLLSYQDNCNIHDCDEYSLRKACEYGHLKIAKFLISLGADVSIFNFLPFRLSVEKKQYDIADMIIYMNHDLFKENISMLIWSFTNVYIEYTRKIINIDIVYFNRRYKFFMSNELTHIFQEELEKYKQLQIALIFSLIENNVTHDYLWDRNLLKVMYSFV
jgi:ankyrin repeat protein